MEQALVLGKSAFSRKVGETCLVLKKKISKTKTNWGDRVYWETS